MNSNNMKISRTTNQVELAELSEFVTKSKTAEMSAHNMAVIQETLEIGESLKATERKQAKGNDRVSALGGEQGSITISRDEIIKAAVQFNTRLHASDVKPGATTEPTIQDRDVPLVTKKEVQKVLDNNRGKAARDDGITVNLLKERNDVVLEKLTTVFSEC